MKTSSIKWLVLTLALAAGASVALAAEADSNTPAAEGPAAAPAAGPTLKAGDAAPKLQTGRWIQGEPVTNFEKGKAYIVEFWATWCPPCRAAIPHLNEKYLKYKDKGLVVIGQDCGEEDDSLVEPFVKKMGDKMTYRVALDDKDGSGKGRMSDTWMTAAGQDGIPTAFLVDTKGVIAWIGSPFDLEDEIIDEVLAGKFDIQKAVAAAEVEKENEAKAEKLGEELEKAMQAKDWDTASAKADEIEKLLPPGERDSIAMVRFGIAISKKDYPAAYQLALKASDAHKDNVQLQNMLAWEIVADPALEQRDLAVAETIAARANDAAGGKEPAVMNTLARALFMRGKKDEAIAMQTKAVGLAEGDTKDQLQSVLDSYKQGDLPKIGGGGAQ